MANLCHRGTGCALKLLALPAVGGAQQGQFVAPAPATAAGNAYGCIPWRRQVGQLQSGAIGVAQIQGQALQGLVCGHAHHVHGLQASAVGADQNVLAVIQRPALALRPLHGQRAGTATPGAAGFPDMQLVALLLQRCGGSHAGPAPTNDGNAQRCVACHGYMRPKACIFHASHSLRSGVRPMRWCKTWKFSASISRSKVR